MTDRFDTFNTGLILSEQVIYAQTGRPQIPSTLPLHFDSYQSVTTQVRNTVWRTIFRWSSILAGRLGKVSADISLHVQIEYTAYPAARITLHQTVNDSSIPHTG